MTWLPLLLSLVVLRIHQLTAFQTPWARGWSLGLISGLAADLAVSLCPVGLAWLLAGSSSIVARRRLARVLAAGAWLICAANLGFMIFFRRSLHLWMLNATSTSPWEIRHAIGAFLAKPLVAVSLLTLWVPSLWDFVRRRQQTTTRPTPSPHWKRASAHLAGAGVLGIACLIHQSPVWFHWPRMVESSYSENILWSLLEEAERGETQTRMPLAEYRRALPRAPGVLGRYTRLDAAPTISETRATDELRRRFGLDPSRRPNLIVLFLESARAFELLDERVGPEAYPNLRKILQAHGIFFPEAYSAANYTVQGQFATLCSRPDREDAAPVYNRQPDLILPCLPAVLASQGYSTWWMNPFHRYFAGKFVFESNHGTQHFLDREFFRARRSGDERNATEWGVSDRVFLDQAFDELARIHGEAGDHPFFAHLLTTGTHAPWHALQGETLPDGLMELTRNAPEHRNYLSTVRALDQALGAFFARFYASPLARDTVVLLLADHGTGVDPARTTLTPLQKQLLWHRIILAAIGGERTAPAVIRHPVRQIDMAPLLASLAGAPIPTEWMGREPLLSGHGSPWMKPIGSRFIYRLQNRLCGKPTLDAPMQCWRADEATGDPLFRLPHESVPEDENITALLKEAIEANNAELELSSPAVANPTAQTRRPADQAPSAFDGS